MISKINLKLKVVSGPINHSQNSWCFTNDSCRSGFHVDESEFPKVSSFIPCSYLFENELFMYCECVICRLATKLVIILGTFIFLLLGLRLRSSSNRVSWTFRGTLVRFGTLSRWLRYHRELFVRGFHLKRFKDNAYIVWVLPWNPYTYLTTDHHIELVSEIP